MKEQTEALLREHGVSAFMWAVHDAIDGYRSKKPYIAELEAQLAALAEFAMDKE